MTLSSEARRHLDRYLDDVRASMSGTESAEIEQDIRDHIDAELGERTAPVSAADLEEVLSRLGDPKQWSAAEPAPQSNRTDEWLGYAALVFLPLLPLGWLVARWTLARIEQRGEPLGARRWVLYPPLAIVSVVLLLLALFWPFGAFAELGTIAAHRIGAVGSDRFPPLVAVAVAIGGLGVYWILLGAAAALGERAVRFVFHPFADGFRRRHAWRLSVIGAVLAAICAVAAFLGSR